MIITWMSLILCAFSWWYWDSRGNMIIAVVMACATFLNIFVLLLGVGQ